MRNAIIIAAIYGLTTAAGAATQWDLAADYVGASNPNGAWQYGEINGGAFSALAWNAPTQSYGMAQVGETFIWKNTLGYTAFGIDPDQVSLEADWGNAAVRWTAPTAGAYTFTIQMGGSTAPGGGGYGNNFASYAAVDINGTTLTRDTLLNNVSSWTFTRVLGTGDYVEAYVLNPGYADGGNTMTQFSVTTSVPEPASWAMLAGGLAILARRRARR